MKKMAGMATAYCKTAATLALVATLASLVGCGFKPVFGGGEHPQKLGEVRVAKINGRTGQVLRNNLQTALAIAERREAKYLLTVSISEAGRSAGIRLQGDLATRGTLTITANFSLKEIGDRRVVYQGKYRTYGSYNISGNAFSNRAAKNHTRGALIDDVSRSIIERVAVFLKK